MHASQPWCALRAGRDASVRVVVVVQHGAQCAWHTHTPPVLTRGACCCRAKGFAKTPDVKLSVPIGVVGRDGKAHVVNWIDSKAMFGDNHTHFTHNGAQLRGYVNRFGPGMVVYWAGVVDTIGQVAGAGPSQAPGAKRPHNGNGAPAAHARPSSGGEGRHGKRRSGGSRGRSRGRDGGSDSDGRARRGGGGGSHGGKPPAPKQAGQQQQQPRQHLWSAAGGESTAEDVVVVSALPWQFVLPGECLVRADPVFKLPPGALSATF